MHNKRKTHSHRKKAIFGNNELCLPLRANAPLHILCILAYLVLALSSCSLEEDSLISQEEANARILAAYLYKDSQCGTTHAVTIPILTKANQKDIETCAIEILSVDCATWGSSNNLPLSCLAISIQQ